MVSRSCVVGKKISARARVCVCVCVRWVLLLFSHDFLPCRMEKSLDHIAMVGLSFEYLFLVSFVCLFVFLGEGSILLVW